MPAPTGLSPVQRRPGPSRSRRQGPTASPPADRWRVAGRALLGAFQHVWVLTLPEADVRRQHMRALLEDQLGIPAERITYLMGASSRRWGRWRGIELLDQARERAAGRQHWWMQTTLCDSPGPKGLGNASAPACLRSRYAECLGRPAGHDGELTVLPRLCRELCYTLSVSSALHAFLQSIHTTALFLEDDLCATPALLRSLDALRWMRTKPESWDMLKLADCFRGVAGIIPHGHVPDASELAATGACALPIANRTSGLHSPANAVLPGLPQASNCAHALGLTRRMAAHLLEQSFPAADVFDNLLTQHVGRQNLRASNKRTGMRMHYLNLSIFAQVGKVTSPAALPKELRSGTRAERSGAPGGDQGGGGGQVQEQGASEPFAG